MSAPTPAPGDDRPREGYYPDPSIPGYVRYWNGSSWVPGTSRPAPKDGEPLSPPPGVRPAVPSVEETGPHFFDEDPQPTASGPGASHPADQWPPAANPAGPGRAGWDRPGRAGQWDRSAASGQPGRAGEWGGSGASGQPGTAGQPGAPGQAGQWGHAGSASQQGQAGQPDSSGAGGPGAGWGADPRVAPQAPAQPDGQSARTDGTATIPPAEDGAPDPGTFIFRRPIPGPAAAARADDGTATPRQAPPGPGANGVSGPAGSGKGAPGGPAVGAQGPVAAPATPSPAAPSAPAPAGNGFGAGKAAAARAAAAAPATPGVPPQAGPQQGAPAPAATPLTDGPGGGQASWAQQVHRLAAGGEEQPVAPWKPPVEDPFQAAARRQAEARPAGLGKRFAARLVDSLVVAAVTAAAAVPLGVRAADHIQQKVDAAKLSGHEVTVWLLDGTTGTCLGVVLGVLLLFGVLYEVLPTVKWGRTLGKKLCGIQVRDIEGHEPPAFGPALRRWLVYSVPGLLGIGIVGVLWCLFDRPWHQCWHDKAAHTFVAG